MKKIVNDEPAQVEDGGERAAGGGGGGVVAEAEKYNRDQKYSWKIWIRNTGRKYGSEIQLDNMDQKYSGKIC